MRIVVVGTSGAGKTTLARRIAAQLQLPHIELDAINWQSEWRDLTRHDPEEFVRRVTGGEGKAVEHSAKAEYSALPQITNGEAITSTNGTIIGSPASA